MKQYEAKKIKNIAVLGHGSSGKTTLCDAMIYNCGEIDKIGSVLEGSAVMDFDSEEKKRCCSVSSAVYSAEYKENKLNIIDAPGLFDFSAGMSEALTAADTALIALSGKSGLNVGSELAYDLAKKENKAIAFFVGKLDSPRAHFYMVMSQLTGKYGSVICPVVVPYVENDEVKCFVDLISKKAYKYNGKDATETEYPDSADIENLHTVMIEAAATVDEELMEKYFEGEEISSEEIYAALKSGMITGDICPVFSGINQTGAGVSLLLDTLIKIFPSPADCKYMAEETDGAGQLKVDENEETAVIVFKTVADPFVGKLSYFKVISGCVKQDMKLINMRTGSEEKITKCMTAKGGKQIDTDKISAGDIGCVAKIAGIITGDTFCSPNKKVKLHAAEYQKPNLSMAVFPLKKGDEEKITQGLQKIIEEDPTAKYEYNRETKETVLSGLGEQHLEVIKNKLSQKFGAEIEMKEPSIAYRETIRKKVKVQGKHKKQSGGHGQFADVWIEFEPCEEDFIFQENVFGGAVPKSFFPAVEKGLRESIQKGVLAGYPMVGLKATLVDGSYHPVDSSEMSFKMAANLAYKAGIPEAMPTLLEPIGTLKVYVPDDYMGDVIGDITKRRGRVLGMNPTENKNKEIVAEVPMAEMGDFATAMRSITQCRSTFTLSFERYEEAPAQVAQKVIESRKDAE